VHIVGCEDLFQLVGPGGTECLDQPVRMRMTSGQVAVHLGEPPLALAQVAAQDRVDEPGRLPKAQQPRGVDGCGDGGRGGVAGVFELVYGAGEQGTELRVGLLARPGQQRQHGGHQPQVPARRAQGHGPDRPAQRILQRQRQRRVGTRARGEYRAQRARRRVEHFRRLARRPPCGPRQSPPHRRQPGQFWPWAKSPAQRPRPALCKISIVAAPRQAPGFGHPRAQHRAGPVMERRGVDAARAP
jgi:hypothetical protein